MNLSSLSLPALGFCCLQLVAQEYVINTVAGAGLPPSPVPALSVGFPAPRSGAVDRFGNLYFNSGGRWVLKVDPAGVLTRVAGLGTAGYSGDGGPAVDALLNLGIFSGLAVDSTGNLYIAAGFVRKVSRDGTITTVSNFAGLSLAVNHEDRLFASQGARVVSLASDGTAITVAGNNVRGYSGDGGPATSAQIFDPQNGCLAFDRDGNLYIADTFNHRIRRVSLDGTISTVAGNGIEGYSGDGGPATAAALALPRGVLVDSKGTIYIQDGGFPLPAHGIRKVTGGTISAATSRPAELLAIDRDDALYFYQDSVIKKMTAAGVVTTVAGNGTLVPQIGNGDGGPAVAAVLSGPADITVDRDRNLYVAETGGHRIRKISAAGIITTLAGNGTAGFSGDGGEAVKAQLNSPEGVAVDSNGNLYISDRGNRRVRKVTPGGIISTFAGGGSGLAGPSGAATEASLSQPQGLGVDRALNLYIADELLRRVFRVTAGGTISTFAGTGGFGSSGDGGAAVSAQISSPAGLAVDSADSVYVLSPDRIRKITPAGIISTVATGDRLSLGFYSPSRIAVDALGNVLIADSTSIVRVPTSTGSIEPIAGSAFRGLSGGDGGLASVARLRQTHGVTVDRDGNVFFTEPDSGYVRVLRPVASAPLLVVNAASFQIGPLSPDSLATAQGRDLATQTQSTASFPSTSLGGTTVRITDSRGTEHAAAISYVSSAQVNFVVPAATSPGPATLRITSGNGTVSTAPLVIATISPGLFLLRPTSLVAANVLRVTDAGQSVENVYVVSAGGTVEPNLIDFGAESDRIFLILYGTGIRGNSRSANAVTVTLGEILFSPLYAGPHPQFLGLDQVNIEVPRRFAGVRDVAIRLTVDGQTTSAGSVSFR